MNKQNGFAAFELVIVLVWLLAIGGWVANVVKLIGMLGGDINTLFIARAIGVVVAPFGAILGFF